jgi:hypothetical protein
VILKPFTEFCSENRDFNNVASTVRNIEPNKGCQMRDRLNLLFKSRLWVVIPFLSLLTPAYPYEVLNRHDAIVQNPGPIFLEEDLAIKEVYTATDTDVQKQSKNLPILDDVYEVNRIINQVASIDISTPDSSSLPSVSPADILNRTPEVNPAYFPSLERFTALVRGEELLGIWVDGYFAFKAYPASWGQVPGKINTASHASSRGYSAFFIHDYLGGQKIYDVPHGAKVAVISPDRIDWYVIEDSVRYIGTPNGTACGYKSPYVEWGQDTDGVRLSAEQVAKRHYQKPFAIQTCHCTGAQSGIHILAGTMITN